MNQQTEQLYVRRFVGEIVRRIIGDKTSPYRQVKENIDRIYEDYFADKEPQGNVLSDELHLALKDQVVDEIRRQCDALVPLTAEIEKDFLAEVKKMADDMRHQGRFDMAKKILTLVSSILRKFSRNRMALVRSRHFSQPDLKDFYDNAKRITWLERIFRNNKSDIKVLHSALFVTTVWESRSILESRVSEYMQSLADQIDDMRRLRYSEILKERAAAAEKPYYHN